MSLPTVATRSASGRYVAVYRQGVARRIGPSRSHPPRRFLNRDAERNSTRLSARRAQRQLVRESVNSARIALLVSLPEGTSRRASSRIRLSTSARLPARLRLRG